MEGTEAHTEHESPARRSRIPAIFASCLSLAYVIFLVTAEYEPSTGFEIRTLCTPGSTAEAVMIASYVTRLVIAAGGLVLALQSVVTRGSLFAWAMSVGASVALVILSGYYWAANCSA